MSTETEMINIGSFDVIPGMKAIFNNNDSSDLLTIPLTTSTVGGKKIVPWGTSNNLPAEIMEKIAKNEVVSRNLEFLINSTYGQGLRPVMKEVINGKASFKPCEDPDVLKFWEDNDIDGYFLEQCADMCSFGNVFPEIRLTADRKKVFSLAHKEAAFSRWGVANVKTGLVDKHYYSAQWGANANENNTVESDVLSRINPFRDLVSRLDTKNYSALRFIMNISFPTPGRVYYQQPAWWSIFNSGSFDFAAMLWNFKKLLLKNGLAVRYIIYISPKYWTRIMTEEKINQSDPEAIKTRKELELTRFREFLTNPDNSGKGMIALKEMIASGNSVIEEKYLTIEEIKTSVKGGEFLEDSSEVSNTISYSMGVYQQLIGTSPGKTGGSLSGTDKREMYMISTALRKPFRDRLILPLKLIKRFNKWPENLEFVVEDFEFTTLDQNKSGKQSNIPTDANQ